MALGYKQQQRVEEAWRTMKNGLKMRPVFQRAPHRIHAHIAITVLSLLLERVIERDCQDIWRNIRDDLKRIQLAQLSSLDGTDWQVTEPAADSAAGSRARWAMQRHMFAGSIKLKSCKLSQSDKCLSQNGN
jgi:hypothetical protein